MHILLASQSIYKQEVLRKIIQNFSIENPQIDESRKEGESPSVLVERLAREKAQAVKADSDTFVIGCDQVAVFGDKILGKPLIFAKAQQQLLEFSGQEVSFLTGIALKKGEVIKSKVELFKVKFRNLSLEEINKYLEKENPLNCAGSFKSEALGILLFSKLEGRDFNSLIGMPLIALNELFLEFNCNLLLS